MIVANKADSEDALKGVLPNSISKYIMPIAQASPFSECYYYLRA